jgi:hypothetical protein
MAITALFAGYQALPDSGAPNSLSNVAVFIVLCPVSLLFMPLFAWFFEAAEPGQPAFYIIWTLIGLENAALYAVIAAYLGRRRRTEGDTSS